MNIDGATIFRSSKSSLWVTQLYQNYLPPEIRFRKENILIVSLYFGDKKPNPFHMVALLARELDDCEINLFDGNKFQCFRPVVLSVSNDLPARAMMQNFKCSTGKSACPICYHPGQKNVNLNYNYIEFILYLFK